VTTKNLKLNIASLLSILIGEYCHAQDWANLERYKNDNTEIGFPKLGEERVVFMGNSITDFWINNFPNYFSNNGYINRGISGQTTPQMLVRFRSDVINIKPDAVIILAGTNDIAGNTGPSSLEMIADNIFSMSELATSNGIKVILCSVLPVYDYPWKPGLNPSIKIIKLNEMIKNYSDNHKIFYLDYYSSMVDDRKGMKAGYSQDGVHPNKSGYEVMMELCSKAIKRVLINK
jgi:lysophospholipase L1-like esterase